MSRIVVCALVAVVVAGCRTYESTHVAAETLHGCFDGVPITVKNPRYLRVTYSEVVRLRPEEDVPLSSSEHANLEAHLFGIYGERGSVMAAGIDTRRLGFREVDRKRTITTDIVAVSEVFTLDVKRPMAGTATYKITWPEGRQYPDSLSATIDDKTLEQMVALAEVFKKDLLDAEKKKAALAENIANEADNQTVTLPSRVLRIEYYDLWLLGCGGEPRLVKVAQAGEPSTYAGG